MGLKRIGILTGGGDCPGLNPSIKAVTKKAYEQKIETIGLKEGWQAFINDDLLPMHLNLDIVRHIDRQGGTILGTSRTNPLKIENGPKKVLDKMAKLKLDALICIGGEDTLGVAHKLYAEYGLNVVGIPKTIDKDLSATDYCLGFSSAVEVITDSIDALRSTAESHSRIFVVEVMGRHAGHLALQGGISSGASVILLPEHNFDIEHVCKLLIARKDRGVRYSIVLAAEGAKALGYDFSLLTKERDAFGHVRLGGVGQWLAEEIEKQCGLESRSVVLSHLQRGGKPCAYDRQMGFYFGVAAVEALLKKRFGQMVAQREGRVILTPIKDAVEKLSYVNIEKFYDASIYRAKQSIIGDII